MISKSYLEQKRFPSGDTSIAFVLQIPNLWLIRVVAYKMILFFIWDHHRKNNIQQSDVPLRQWSLKFYWNLQLLKIVLKDTVSSWGPLKYNISSKHPLFSSKKYGFYSATVMAATSSGLRKKYILQNPLQFVVQICNATYWSNPKMCLSSHQPECLSWEESPSKWALLKGIFLGSNVFFLLSLSHLQGAVLLPPTPHSASHGPQVPPQPPSPPSNQHTEFRPTSWEAWIN